MDDQGRERRTVSPRFDRLDDGLARGVDDCGPVLFGLQPGPRGCGGIAVWVLGGGGVEEMADGYQDDDRVLALRRSSGINARRHVDVERGFAGYTLPLENRIETLAVLVRKEDVVRL